MFIRLVITEYNRVYVHKCLSSVTRKRTNVFLFSNYFIFEKQNVYVFIFTNVFDQFDLGKREVCNAMAHTFLYRYGVKTTFEFIYVSVRRSHLIDMANSNQLNFGCYSITSLSIDRTVDINRSS